MEKSIVTETQADFARRCDVSRKTVSAWKKAGRLVLQGDQVDVEASIALLERYRPGGAPTVTSAVTPAVTPPESGNTEGNSQAGNETDQGSLREQAPEIALLPGERVEEAAVRLGVTDIDMDMSLDEARRMKEVRLVLSHQLDYETKIGSLVDLDLARNVLFEEARAWRDTWLNWPAKVGPMVAAELGVEASDLVTEVLTKYVHNQICQLGELDPQFTESH
ncbi:hypothetical protein BG58_31430 [Caballeronia jiangsuensis]|nr:hypothetical protein BG58_31430 [Caballeronia jiangsuensis]